MNSGFETNWLDPSQQGTCLHFNAYCFCEIKTVLFIPIVLRICTQSNDGHPSSEGKKDYPLSTI